MSTADERNFDPLFHNNILHLEDHDFTEDGRLNLPDQYKGKCCVVMIFAVWCGPCAKLKPEFAQLPGKLGNNVTVAAINGSGKDTLASEQALMKRLRSIVKDFRGFPTVAIFDKNGNFVGTHEGPRKCDSIIETLQKHM